MTYKTKLTRGIALLLAATICTGALSGCSDAERPRDNDTEEQENDTALGGIFDSHILKVPEDDIQAVVVEDADNDPPIALKNQTPSDDQIKGLPDGANAEYAALYEANNDFVGWINIQGTKVNYPVMQSADLETFTPCNTYMAYGYCEFCEQIMKDPQLAAEFYLHHDFGRNYLFAGNIFADYQGKIGADEMPDNTILYGHNMLYEFPFAALSNYKVIDSLKMSPVIDFNTLYNDNKYKIFSVFLVNTTDEYGEVFDYSNSINFADSADFYDYIVECMDRSLYETGVDIKYGDELLTLSTFDESTGFNDMRLVIVARKVRPDEAPTVDIDKIVKKDSIKYFDAYYEAYGNRWSGRTWDTSLVEGLDDYLG